MYKVPLTFFAEKSRTFAFMMCKGGNKILLSAVISLDTDCSHMGLTVTYSHMVGEKEGSEDGNGNLVGDRGDRDHRIGGDERSGCRMKINKTCAQQWSDCALTSFHYFFSF